MSKSQIVVYSICDIEQIYVNLFSTRVGVTYWLGLSACVMIQYLPARARLPNNQIYIHGSICKCFH